MSRNAVTLMFELWILGVSETYFEIGAMEL